MSKEATARSAISTERAMKLALEALGEIEWSNNSQWQSDRAKVAITALREALAEQPAQPQQVPVAWMYDRARYGPTDLRGQQWLPELSRLKPYTGNGMVRGLIPLYTHPQACELEQVEKDLRFHGLTLVKTATGYAVLKLGHITAHGIKENT